jgi:hypothetical protein
MSTRNGTATPAGEVRALAHHSDPVASHEAAANLDRERDSRVKQAILQLLAEAPRADFQLKRAYASLWQANGWPELRDIHSVARRRSELHTREHRVRAVLDADGKQVRIKSPHGASATIWELVPAEQGMEAAA